VKKQGVPASLRFLLAVATFVMVSLPAVSVLGQTSTSTTQIQIDSPVPNVTVMNTVQIDVGGWAVNPSGPGTGVDSVRVYLDNTMENNGVLLGTAVLGGSRPDVASTLKNPAYANSGYDFLWTPAGLSPGPHSLLVYAHAAAGWSYRSVSVTAQPQPAPTPMPNSQYGPGYGYGYGGNGYDNGYPFMGGLGYGSGAYGPDTGFTGYPFMGGYGYGGGYPFMGGYGPYGCMSMYSINCSGVYPAYPMYPPYPPVVPPVGGGVCIMIYPPPPGCY